MEVLVYSRAVKVRNIGYIKALFEVLQRYDIEFAIYDQFAFNLRKNGIDVPYNTFNESNIYQSDANALICLGGDGSILDTLKLVSLKRIPVMGINLGRLGFLADISKENITEAIHALKNGMYTIENRAVLELLSSDEVFENPYALNEFTVQRKETSSMITVHTYLNGELLTSYWADGLIVSTPTGSTGYSLSCGGPIIHPSAENVVITPVAPHNLNVRPMVVDDNYVISFEVEGKGPIKEFLCTLDSRFTSFKDETQLAVKKADFPFQLIRISDQGFLTAIKTKLYWGLDTRN